MDWTSVLVGLMCGAGAGTVVGFVAGRLTGIGEGVYRERRRAEHAEMHRAAQERAWLEVDSWAEFGDEYEQPRPLPPPRARQALDRGQTP